MAQKYNLTRVAYQLGCAAVVMAFLDKVFTVTSFGLELAIRTRIVPHNFLEASIVFFVMSIASEAYTSAQLRAAELKAAGKRT